MRWPAVETAAMTSIAQAGRPIVNVRMSGPSMGD